jgi:hypothetical protein
VPNGKALSRASELAGLYMKAPEVTRRNTRVHSIQPLKERIIREVGYGLSLEGASAADLVKSMQANNESAAQKKSLLEKAQRHFMARSIVIYGNVSAPEKAL